MSIKFKSNEQGKCPLCNSMNLSYGTLEVDDGLGNSCYYPWHCDDCGADGKEWYYSDFLEIVANTSDGDVTGSEEGVCPECGEGVNYLSSEPDGESLGYEFECPACGATGTEWYDMSFDSHTIDGHEDEVIDVMPEEMQKQETKKTEKLDGNKNSVEELLDLLDKVNITNNQRAFCEFTGISRAQLNGSQGFNEKNAKVFIPKVKEWLNKKELGEAVVKENKSINDIEAELNSKVAEYKRLKKINRDDTPKSKDLGDEIEDLEAQLKKLKKEAIDYRNDKYTATTVTENKIIDVSDRLCKVQEDDEEDTEPEEENDIDWNDTISLLDIALSEIPVIGIEDWGKDDELLFTADTKVMFENLKDYEEEIPKYYYDNASNDDWSNGIDDYLEEMKSVNLNSGDSDNTYNWGAPLTHNVEFTMYEADDGCYFKGSIHRAGDVRGNYTTEFLLKFNDKDDCLETLFTTCSENCYRNVTVDGVDYTVLPHFFDEYVDIWCPETQESYDDVYCDCIERLREIIAENKDSNE